jgi:RimJ/RimL family protein N-acetyltransferase
MEEAFDNIAHIRGQYEEFGVGRLAVINKETNQFVGWSGLKFINEETNQHLNYYDVGYRFIKDYWGFGYATESAKAVIEYGFDKLSIKELFAIADFENVKSQHVLEKIGFIKKEIFMYNNRNHYWFEL